MIEKLTEQEIEFLECLYNPVCLIESLFSDLDKPNLTLFDERFSHIRFAQLALLSYEYLIDSEQSSLSVKENFILKINSGTVYCFGARRWGKTLFTEITDLLISMLLNDGENCGFSSYDAIHIRGVLEVVIQALENHPILKLLDAHVNRSPSYRITLRNGYSCEGVNMNIAGENPGGQFFQKHFSRLYIEEASQETEEVYKKRLDSISELGCVYRLAGMTNYTKYSPPGRIFYDYTKKQFLVNYPQYVNPYWNEKAREQALKDHSGENSITFRIFVLGEIVEEGISAIDMERVRKNYNDKKFIKSFEINKENFSNFEDILIVERPVNVENVFISSDIGEIVTKIIIHFSLNQKYKYIYKITLYNLTDKEQFPIFRFLGEKLQANYIALDTTEGMGRAIYRSLEEVFSKENLVWCSFTEKIKVDFEKDEQGNILFKDGEPIYKEEYIDAWSVKRLRDLLYEEDKVELPIDYELDGQLNSVIATQSGNRTLYSAISAEDHLLAAWRVFAISEWKNYLTINRPIKKKTHFKGII